MDSPRVMTYRSLTREGTYEEVIQKSRFIGYAAPARTQEDALAYISSIHERHPEASSICHGYVCGTVQRFFDGHEPVGGMPVLDALRKRGIVAAAAVVVRYFGGVKLGMGGLARAFGGVAVRAVEEALPSVYVLSRRYELTYPYELQGKMDYFLKRAPIRLEEIAYRQDVTVRLTVEDRRAEAFLAQAGEIAAGALLAEAMEGIYLPETLFLPGEDAPEPR